MAARPPDVVQVAGNPYTTATRRGAARGLPPPGLLGLVSAVPVASGTADDQPPGLHFNADGRVAAVMFDGPEPDPAVLAALNERLPPRGLAITALPCPELGVT